MDRPNAIQHAPIMSWRTQVAILLLIILLFEVLLMISSRFDRVATLISAGKNINQETISITTNIPKATNNGATLLNSNAQSRISNIHYSATTNNMSQNLFDLMQDRERIYYSDRSDTDSRPSMQLLLLYYPTVFHIIKDAEFFTDSRVNEVSDITILTNTLIIKKIITILL